MCQTFKSALSLCIHGTVLTSVVTFQFSHLIDDNTGSKFDMIGSGAVSNKENAREYSLSTGIYNKCCSCVILVLRLAFYHGSCINPKQIEVRVMLSQDLRGRTGNTCECGYKKMVINKIIALYKLFTHLFTINIQNKLLTMVPCINVCIRILN